ncbi:hypothetical protein HMPREF9130_1010 [Peptoniphilus sp. oral taxon 375 str. F0436]|nr:hypothetical protein HMPREF9130_1010 [Peptoniphilus sp. oral taxon 375 str. F0436]
MPLIFCVLAGMVILAFTIWKKRILKYKKENYTACSMYYYLD